MSIKRLYEDNSNCSRAFLFTKVARFTVKIRLIDIYSSTAKTVDALMKLELPSGVEVEIKV